MVETGKTKLIFSFKSLLIQTRINHGNKIILYVVNSPKLHMLT